MRRKTYPLDSLMRVRKDRARVATAELSRSIDVREEAERARIALDAQREQEAALVARARGAEAEALAHGSLAAADLQRQGAWEARVAWEAAERARALTTAEEAEERARSVETSARSGVAQAEAAARVVGAHHDRWTADGERKAEAAAEEGAAEAWRRRG